MGNNGEGLEALTFPELLFRGVPETSKSIQDIVIALGCPPGPDGRTLLLKPPQCLVTGEIKLILTRDCAPAASFSSTDLLLFET